MLSQVLDKIQTVLNTQALEAIPARLGMGQDSADTSGLAMACARLGKINITQAKQAKRAIFQVMEIDAEMVVQIKQLTRNYMISINNNRDVQAAIQAEAFAYEQALFACYAQFLEVYEHQQGIALTQNEFALIIGRLLNALFLRAKWAYFDDQAAPAGSWDVVHKIIKIVEKSALMNHTFDLYEFSDKRTSIAAILQQGLMLDTLRYGNFSRLEIQLAERILRTWVDNPILEPNSQLGEHLYCIKLSADSAPQRVGTVEGMVQYRYWRTHYLTELLDMFLADADAVANLSQLNIEGIAPTQVLLKLFKKLRAEWGGEPTGRQRRKETRTQVSKQIHVCYGLEDICHRMNLLQEARNAAQAAKHDVNATKAQALNLANNFKQNALGLEAWTVVDESENGFAVDLGSTLADWVVVGKLVGYTKSHEEDLFYIAEIKSMRKQASGSYRIGLEIITQQGLPVQVSRIAKQADHKQILQFEGIYLSSSKQASLTSDFVIMPRTEYVAGRHYLIKLGAEDKVVRPGLPTQAQRDWVQVPIAA